MASVRPLSEQEQITKYLESEASPFDTPIARTEREITLLQEYRTHLTADIVTGKLDVREAAAKLPDPPSLLPTLLLITPRKRSRQRRNEQGSIPILGKKHCY